MTTRGVPLALAVATAGYLAGAVAALPARSSRGARWAAAAGASLGSLAALVLAVQVLVTGAPVDAGIPGLLAVAGGVVVRLDGLGAFFLAIVSIIGLPAAVYGAGYSADETTGHLRSLGFMLNMFLFGMSLVTCAGNVLTFVLGWEVMSLASYFLVMVETGDPETQSAGLWYIAMTHFGLVLLLPMFFLLSSSGGGASFADLRLGAGMLTPAMRNVVFILAVLAFGSKAGVVPLHVWLPRAHPAAPSHVSALMSGVMIKLGIYGLVRVTLDVLGGGVVWWGGLLLAVGSVSALLGVLYALMEHDLKRLLAYHSVENIGIILIGFGAALVLDGYGLRSAALVGFAASLFHTLNHACFKALLFLGAGSVLRQTHTRNMEQMGGLITRMPQTALLFLVGAVAIAALPPLNGFASEWMVFQTLLAGAQIPRPELAVGIPMAVGMLALTSGLAAACFVKAFGVTFLAMPRSERAAQAREAPLSMRAAMALLASACVVLGLGASMTVPVLYRALEGLGGVSPAAAAATPGLWVEGAGRLAYVSPPLLAASLAVVVFLGWLAVRRALGRARLTDTWGCGRIGQTPRMEYTASAFAEPLRRVFAELYRPAEDLTVSTHPESRYFIRSITYTSEVHPWFEAVIYDPIIGGVRRASTEVRRLQGGSAHLYLLYVVAALLGALGWVWWS